jgi:hypothetical protein
MSAIKIYVLLFTLILAVLWIFNYARLYRTVGHGDVDQFILQKAERFGCTPITTNGLPQISNQWRYREFNDGVLVDFPNQSFPAALKFLRQAFGPENGSGNSNRYYEFPLSTNGASIYLHQWNKNTELMILSHPEPTLSMKLPKTVLNAL